MEGQVPIKQSIKELEILIQVKYLSRLIVRQKAVELGILLYLNACLENVKLLEDIGGSIVTKSMKETNNDLV